jgi:hypothetical protein
MTKRKQDHQPTANSIPHWNQQAQQLTLDLGSGPARRRLLARIARIMLWTAACIALVFILVRQRSAIQEWCQELGSETLPVFPEVKIEGLVALPESTVIAMLGESMHTDLTFINPYTIKSQLEALGQVREAKITKEYPNCLRIVITENQPVLMLAAQDHTGTLSFWAIGEDGILFKPHHLERVMALGLPFLEGIKLDRMIDGETRVEGMQQVHHLLQLLKHDLYPVYADLRSVSLQHFRGGNPELLPLIILKGRHLRELRFGIENLEYQVVKLISVLSISGKLHLDQKKVIDLSISTDAMIR